ncbi:amidohydrolase [Pasteurella testudinis]|uniref:amidohydrolase n=1 Tax=Pasteurella testudinis TaxID=761 RepID=UPI00405992D5
MLYSQSRRHFLTNSALFAGGCAVVGLSISKTSQAETKNNQSYSEKELIIHDNEYYLYNVIIEKEFNYQNDKIISTKTGLYTLHIKDKKIINIIEQQEKNHPEYPLPSYNANGFLIIPPLKDMHIHIDKTWYGLPWQTISRKGMSIKDIIALEQRILPGLLETSIERTNQCIQLMNSKGTFIARSHCNIEPTSRLQGLENLQTALDNNKERIRCEVVAFPQHGLLLSNSEKLMREAMQHGADYVGGLDPTTVDNDMKKSLDTLFSIALDYNKGIDIHLHEGKASGIPAIEYIIARTKQEKQLQNRVTISHAFALSGLSSNELQPIAEALSENGITIASTIPLGNTMPLPALSQANVSLMTGTDSILDWWSPLGSGDMLEKAHRWAELYRWTDEYDLSRALKIATAGKTILDDQGNYQWPNIGDNADFVLVRASCSAEAVARLPLERIAIYQGKTLSI